MQFVRPVEQTQRLSSHSSFGSVGHIFTSPVGENYSRRGIVGNQRGWLTKKILKINLVLQTIYKLSHSVQTKNKRHTEKDLRTRRSMDINNSIWDIILDGPRMEFGLGRDGLHIGPHRKSQTSCSNPSQWQPTKKQRKDTTE